MVEGVFFTRAEELYVNNDSRRRLTEIFNAKPGDALEDFVGKQAKILEGHQNGAVLGNHYHTNYDELYFVARGQAGVLVEGVDRETGDGTGESDRRYLWQGYRILIPQFVAHRITINKNCMLIGVTTGPYLGEGKSDRKYDFETHRTVDNS